MAGTLGVTGVITGGGLVVPDGSLNLADLDIDGGTDIGAALVDADLMIVDDGAGGTNRKATMTRLSTYIATKITGGSMVYLASSGAISNAANASFTQFDSSKYDSYQFKIIDLLPATDDVELRVLTSSDTSSHSFDTGSADYIRQGNSTQTAAFGQLVSPRASGNGAQEVSNLMVSVMNPHTNKYTWIATTGGALGLAAGYHTGVGNAVDIMARAEAGQVNAIRFFMESGNIASGEIVMYGIANGS